jgi:hypothetical protein
MFYIRMITVQYIKTNSERDKGANEAMHARL